MNLLLSALFAAFVAVLAFFLGQFLGVTQPLLGFICFAIFLILTFYAGRGNWFNRPR